MRTDAKRIVGGRSLSLAAPPGILSRPTRIPGTRAPATRQWVRAGGRPGPWHLVIAGDTYCEARFSNPELEELAGVPERPCKICAGRRRHELNHPEPIEPVPHAGFNLHDPADAIIYRGRVAETFRLCRINLLIQHVVDAGGPRPPADRAQAVTALADAWICQATGGS